MEKITFTSIYPYTAYKLKIDPKIKEIIQSDNWLILRQSMDTFHWEEMRILKYLVANNKQNLFKNLMISYDFDLSIENNIFLSIAVANGSYDVIEYLLQNGVNANTSNNTAIKLASAANHQQCLKLLIDNGADIHFDNNFPLKQAAYFGLIDNIKILVENGANIRTTNDYPIRIAGHHDHILKYLISHGADISADNYYVLRNCVQKNYYQSIKILLEAGANIGVLSMDDLIRVINKDSYQTLQLLMEYGVDFSIVNQYDNNKNNISRIVNLLVSNGIDPKKMALIYGSHRW